MRRIGTWGLVMVALAAACGLAQPQIENVELGLGGRFLPKAFTPIVVSIRNDGIPRSVVLEIFQRAERGSLERVHRSLALGPQTRQHLSLDFPIKSVSAPLEIVLRDATGELAHFTKDVRQSWSESPLTLGIALQQRPPLAIIDIEIEELPKRWTSYEGVGRIFWGRADPARVSAEQRWALQGWLVRGGELIVLSGANWHEQSPAPPWWEELLPITEGHLVRRNGQEIFWLEGKPRPQAKVMLSSQGYPLAWEHPIGDGRVLLVASDVWPEELPLPTLSQARPAEEDLLIAQALASLTIPFPSRELIGIILILFVVVVGLSGVSATREARLPFWLGGIALALSVGLYSYQHGAAFSSEKHSVEMGVIQLVGPVSRESYWYGVFFQHSREDSLVVAADAISALSPGALPSSQQGLVRELTAGGEWRISLYGERNSTRFLKAERLREPWLSLRLDGSAVALANRAPVAVQDAIAYSAGAFYKLGTIPAQAELVRPLSGPMSQAAWLTTLTAERRRLWQQWGRLSHRTKLIGWIEDPRASPIGVTPGEHRTALYLVLVEGD
jgi:hypothetical protein